jgi:hypothetical protein
VLQRGVILNDKDPGIRYQLFLAYSRLKRKDEGEHELAVFRQLDEATKHAATPLGQGRRGVATAATEAPAILPPSVANEPSKPPAPRN